MGTIDDIRSILTQSALSALCEKFHIPSTVHPELPDQMDLFAFIQHADPTKVRICERQIEEGQTPLLMSNEGRVVQLAGENEQGNQNDNVQDASHDVVNEEGVGADQGDHVDAGIVRADDDDVPTTVAEKAKEPRKKKKTVGATVPFVTLSPERVGGGHTDFISGPNLRTQHPAERFVISSDSSHHSSTNAANVKVTSLVRSPVPPPLVMTAAIATTAIASVTSVLVPEARTRSVNHNLFLDSASPSSARTDVASPSQPVGVEVCCSMVDHLAPSGFFSQLWGMDYEQLFREFNVGVARQACFSAEVRLRSEHNYRKRKKFKEKCRRQNDLLKDELDGLKERTIFLEGQLSCDELTIKASSLKSQKDSIVDQIEAVQDKQVKVLSDRVAELDSELMGMTLHLDKEFYPHYLTTIARRRAIGCAIDMGMQDGLAVDIDHRKSERGLSDVAAYNPSAKANYISAVNALRVMDFPLLAQLESHKDESIADIMGLLHLEGLAAETSEARQLQPSPE
nr:hypothetical protein [Tanacetum cinerariifolium]